MAFNVKYKQKYNFSDGSDLLDLIQNHTNSDPALVRTTGNQTINGTKTFVNDINGTAVKAKYADLAEIYVPDNDYDPGTLIKFGGKNQITIADTHVNGVISERPAILINRDVKGLPVALAGQVKVKITGKINKFDKIKLSNIPGIGIKSDDEIGVIAISLESKDDLDIAPVLCTTLFRL